MKLLILGESDSHGFGLDDPSRAWGNLLPVELARESGVEVEATHLAYYAHTATSLAYLERVLAKGPFDVVVLSVTSIGFTLLSVDHRMGRLFGPRIGEFFKSGVDTFDSTTRRKGDQGWLKKTNRAAHALARKAIGQEPMASYDFVLENYKQIIARLARLEDTEVVLLGPTDHAGRLAQRARKTQPQVETFRAVVRAEAERRRLTWIDRQKMSEMFPDRDAEFVDGLHKGPGFHGLIVSAVVAVLAKPGPVLTGAAR
jgi:hypothetical protein